MDEVRQDVRVLSATALKEKYTGTYVSFHAMKYGAQRTRQIASEFATFAGFLAHVGPRRHKDLTLDRVDNSNPVYGPGFVEWKDKSEQANNRSSTITLT